MIAMPWKESRIVDERVKFVAEVLKGERKITELCQQYAIQGRLATNGLNGTKKPGRKDWKTLGGDRKAVRTRRQSRLLKRFWNCDTSIRPGVHGSSGLPDRIRTENGRPFATTGPLGLSKLSIKWGKLGILHERIHSGEPGENGRHERMHRTLKLETATPPAFTRSRLDPALGHEAAGPV